jgi:uncharacterized protein (TIGR03437 family)
LVVLFATGEGVTVPASRTGASSAGDPVGPVLPVHVLIDGLPSEIGFLGRAPGSAGVLQINARVPDGAIPGERSPVVLSVGDRQSPPINIAVR